MHFATTRDALAWAAQQLVQAGIANARREAQWLLEHVLLLPADATSLVADTPLNVTQQTAFIALVERRARREPLQYLLETVDFAGVTLRVTPTVLIPRPETELLVEHAAAAVINRTAPLQCADLGTGSGCIAIALATRLPRAHWWACDLERNGVRQRGTGSGMEFAVYCRHVFAELALAPALPLHRFASKANRTHANPAQRVPDCL